MRVLVFEYDPTLTLNQCICIALMVQNWSLKNTDLETKYDETYIHDASREPKFLSEGIELSLKANWF